MAAVPSTYEAHNILITGAAGFIASHVAIRLVKNYPHYKVVALDCMDYCANLRNLDSIIDKPNFKFIKGNIQSSDLINYVLMSEEIDTIMHFAAQTHVDNSFGNSMVFTANNIYGTHTLLESSKALGKQIQRFVHVSTDEVYGENLDYDSTEEGNQESRALDPTNPYAATKAGAEMLVKAYTTSYGLPTVITRGNNVYGPHQFPEKLIPKMIMMASHGMKLTIHGEGKSKRSYLFVEDVAAAFDTILHRGHAGKIYNIGTQVEETVHEVVHSILGEMKSGEDPESHIDYVVDRPFNDSRYYIDTSALASLGWKQEVCFEEGLKRTIEWYTKMGVAYWGSSLNHVLVAHPRPSGSGPAGEVGLHPAGALKDSPEVQPKHAENGINIYEAHNILITGAAGFIASHVAIRLVKNYPHYKVVALDCMDYCANLRNLDSIIDKPNFKFIKGNIQSSDLINYVLMSEEIDTIMHFAAQTHVDNSFGNSMVFSANNIYGTHVLLESSKALGKQIQRFVHVSTDEVYGENLDYDSKEEGNQESRALDPTNPYAATKAGAEMLVKAYTTSYGLPTVITRGNNVYGPHQFPEKLIPKMIMMASHGMKLTIHGEGKSKRSYLFVEDVAAAFDTILHRGHAGKIYNIGTQVEETVHEVVHSILGEMKSGEDPESHIDYVVDRPFNDSRYYIDTSALASLGWKQEVCFEEGLKRTIEWYTKMGVAYWGSSLNHVLVAHPRPSGSGPAGEVQANAPNTINSMSKDKKVTNHVNVFQPSEREASKLTLLKKGAELCICA